jgi:protocatechuate 3,4-dioxygenase beta subunit
MVGPGNDRRPGDDRTETTMDGNDHGHDHDHDDDRLDRGLAFDLTTLLSRRGMFGLLAGAGLLTVAGCSSGGDGAATGVTSAPDSTTAAAGSDAECAEIPEETGGPFPGDGSNGPDILSESGIVRSDIRSSFGSASGVAAGVPLTIDLTIVDNNGCSPRPGAAVYLWHCDREGRYSMYSEGAQKENYLRGVQAADASGKVRFTSIFPAAYSGRWPHVHFEVYPGVDAAQSSSQLIRTSQLALPEAACTAVYATSGYEASVGNMARTSLGSDMVFADGVDQQLATMSGDAASGYTASLTVTV